MIRRIVRLPRGGDALWTSPRVGTMFEAEFFGVVVSGTALLTGNSVTQASTTSAGAIAQTHLLTGLASAQAAASTSGAIVQVHVLYGLASVQSAVSAIGQIAQTHRLSGVSIVQAGSASNGGITVVTAPTTDHYCSFLNNQKTASFRGNVAIGSRKWATYGGTPTVVRRKMQIS